MTKEGFFAIAIVTATAFGGAALADPGHGRGEGFGAGPGTMMGQFAPGFAGDPDEYMHLMMRRMHGPMMGHGMGVPGPMGFIGGAWGPGGAMGPMGGGMMWMLDTDGDGIATPQEIREAFQAKLKEYDANGDGTLSIGEFETLHSAMIRETMVDRFQYLDADGDGAVTEQEMSAPADRMEHMQDLRERMWEGWPQGQGGRRPMWNRRMMDDD